LGPKDPAEKTVEGQLSGGSPKDPAGNPSLSAENKKPCLNSRFFYAVRLKYNTAKNFDLRIYEPNNLKRRIQNH
jgi:hypothetical protein